MKGILEQASFSTGEVSPELYGRTDFSRFMSSLRLCSNFFVKSEGGVTKRPGTKFVCPVKDAANWPRLVEFNFSDQDTYILEFGDSYLRVVRNGSLVNDVVSFTATVADDGSGNALFTLNGGSIPSDGSQVVVALVGDALSLRGRFLEVTAQDGNDFTLIDWETGDTVQYEDDMAGETITLRQPYEIPTPFSAQQARELKFVQSADVLYIVHPDLPPQKLSRTVGGNFPTFTITSVIFNNRLEAPTLTGLTRGWVIKSTGVASDYPNNYGSEKYVVTSFDSTGANAESLPSVPFIVNRDNNWASTTAESVIRFGGFNSGSFPTGADSYRVYKEVGGSFLFIGEILNAGDDFDDANLTPPPGAATPPENRLPLGLFIQYSGASGTLPVFGETVTGGTSGATGQVTFVTRASNASTGIIVLSGVSGTFSDAETLTGDIGFGSVTPADIDTIVNEYPSVVTFFEDRLCFAASTLNPQTVWTSQTGLYENFSISQNIIASDAVTFTLNARTVNKIEALIPDDDLVCLTSAAVWRVGGAGENEPLGPASIRAKPQNYNGASSVDPLFIEDVALYVQDKSQRVRDLYYEFATDAYTGTDLTVLSRHLFRKRSITDWCLAKDPNELIWSVMDDGKLTCLTYLREQNVRGWSRHSLGGADASVLSIASIPQTTTDTGLTVEYDAAYMVVARTDSRCHIERLQPREFDGLENCWFLDGAAKVTGDDDATGTVYGLWHMEGQTVWALNGANVEEDLVVTNGRVTLQTPTDANVVLIGHPYTAAIETLDFAVQAEGGAFHAQRRRVGPVYIRTFETRGIEVGENAGGELNPYKERLYIPNEPIELTSKVIEVTPIASYEREGRAYIQAKYPLPAEILSIMPTLVKGG